MNSSDASFCQKCGLALDEEAALELDREEDFSDEVDVKNNGGTEGTYKAAWKVEGRTDDTQKINLGPGDSRTVNFSMVWEEAGNYNVSINELEKSIKVNPALEIIEHRKIFMGPTNSWPSSYRIWISGIMKNNTNQPINRLLIPVSACSVELARSKKRKRRKDRQFLTAWDRDSLLILILLNLVC